MEKLCILDNYNVFNLDFRKNFVIDFSANLSYVIRKPSRTLLPF